MAPAATNGFFAAFAAKIEVRQKKALWSASPERSHNLSTDVVLYGVSPVAGMHPQ
jgi:hypothetical protein